MLDLAAIPVDQLRGMAQSAIGQSDYAGADRALRELIRRSPRDVDAILLQVTSLLAQGFRQEALSLARRATGLAPREWRTHTALAGALCALNQVEQAARAYRLALDLRPDDPGLMVALAGLLDRLRRSDESLALAKRAIEVDPAFGPAMNLISQVVARTGDEQETERWLLRAVEHSNESEPRATAWHQLGALREKQKRWDEAFACHDRANRVQLSTPTARHLIGLPLFDHLDPQFRPGCEPMLARWSVDRFTDGPPDPVFLVGFPRSGTTMTEIALGALPGSMTTDEEPIIADAFQLAMKMCGDPPLAQLAESLDALTDRQIVEIRREYWRSASRLISADAPKASLFVDKAPLQFTRVLFLTRLFPRSRMIFVVRDPRDCCLSCFFQQFTLTPSLVKFLTLETTGDLYAEVMTFWMRARTRMTMPVLEVRYEDMVADFETHARRLVEFVGRPWSDEVLRFHEKASGRSIRTPSYRAVTEKVNTRAVGKWAKYEAHLGPLLDRVRPFLEPLGYEE